MEEMDIKLYANLSNGERLCYRKVGIGKNQVIWIHGDGSDSFFWKFQLKYLNDFSQFTYYFVDLRGYGHSSYNKPIFSSKDFSEDIDLFAQIVGIKDPILFGFSLGGTVQATLASLYPEKYKKLILVAPLGTRGMYLQQDEKLEVSQQKENIRQMVMQVFPQIQNKFICRNKEEIRTSLQLHLTTENPAEQDLLIEEACLQRNFSHFNQVFIDYNISSFNGGEGISKNFKGKGFIILGEKDVAIPIETGEKFKIDMPQADLEIKVVDAGHIGLIEKPLIYYELINQYLIELIK